MNLVQLSELVLGRDAPRPRPRVVRLPASALFVGADGAKGDGAACYGSEVLRAALAAVHASGCDLTLAASAGVADASSAAAGAEVLSDAYNAAVAAGAYTPPRLAFDGHPSGSIPVLEELATSLGGSVVKSAAEATHVVMADAPQAARPDATWGRLRGSVQHDGERWWRVHWMCTPDSHDSWVKESEAGASAAECEREAAAAALAARELSAGGTAVRVPLQWLIDSAEYNEWCNAADYLDGARGLATPPGAAGVPKVEDMDTDALPAASEGVAVDAPQTGVGEKRQIDGASGANGDAKRVRLEGEHVTLAGRGSGATVAQYPPDSNAAAVAATAVPADGTKRVENLSQGQLTVMDPDAFAGLGARAAAAAAAAAAASGVPGAYGGVAPRVGAVELYRVPAYAAWFEWDGVHDIERTHLPEFFNGRSFSKTAAVYKQYRNFMIDKFREDASRKLTFTECRRELVGDVSSMLRVYQFLDAWGLINFGVGQANEQGQDTVARAADAATASAHAAAAAAAAAMDAPRPGLQVVGGQAVADVYTVPPPSAVGAATAAAVGNRLAKPLGAADGPAGIATAALVRAAATRGSARVICNASGVDCTEMQYHCVTVPDHDLCPAAYRSGQFPPNVTAADFVLVRAPASAAAPKLADVIVGGDDETNAWSASESLLLLEALEEHGDNWEAVAEHVGTKSRLQCVTHFLRLPLQDEYIEQLDKKGAAAVDELAARDEGKAPAPFEDAANPVMAQVAFLAAMVGPKVAAAAAQAALSALAEEEPSLAAGGGSDAGEQGEPNATETAGAGAGTDASTGADGAPSLAKVKQACATGLAAAAVKAKLLADAEERELQRLVGMAVQSQLSKVEAKMKAFEELERVLQQERDQVAVERRKLMAERVDIAAARAAAKEAVEKADADTKKSRARADSAKAATASLAGAAKGKTGVARSPKAVKGEPRPRAPKPKPPAPAKPPVQWDTVTTPGVTDSGGVAPAGAQPAAAASVPPTAMPADATPTAAAVASAAPSADANAGAPVAAANPSPAPPAAPATTPATAPAAAPAPAAAAAPADVPMADPPSGP